MEQYLRIAAISYLIGMTLLGFAVMGIDKHKAVKKGWRIKERTLLLIAYLGGGIGAFFGMYIFRHKTRHIKFVLLVPVAAAVYAAVIYLIFKTG